MSTLPFIPLKPHPVAEGGNEPPSLPLDIPPPEGATFMPEPAPKRSLLDIVAQLAGADDELADRDFDPAQLVGDLRGKVDAVQSVLLRMESVADFLMKMVTPIHKKAQSLRNNHQRLRNYITTVMETNKFESLPGELWKINLRDSPAALQIGRIAGPDDMLKFPDFVTCDRVYNWDNEKIKATLLNDPKSLPEGIPASVTKGHWPDIKPNVPASLEKPKKPRKKKGVVDVAVAPQ